MTNLPGEIVAAPTTTNTVDCWRCGSTPAAGTCCSSHKKDLCHRCYRLTHFVEVCGSTCPECAAEGLPVVFPSSAVSS